MSAESDARFAALAKRLIDANGREVTIISSSGYQLVDENKPWEGVSSESITFTLTGVFTKVSQDQLDGIDDARLSNISSDIKGVILPASDVTVEITTGDKLTDNGKRYEVLMVNKVQPGSGEIIYKLVVGA